VDEELRRELLARRDEDQRIRTLVSPLQGQHAVRLPGEVAAEWQRIDEDNTRWLVKSSAPEAGRGGRLPARTAQQRRGCWPSTPTAILSGSGPSWMPCAARSINQGEALPAHLAYLEDRVRVNAGQPQLYGTQFTVTDGHFGPRPIEDPQWLDERRAAAGLEPFADYEARMRGLS
jgi:hypothetical protein